MCTLLMVNWWKADMVPAVHWPGTVTHGHRHVVFLCSSRAKACLPDKNFEFASLVCLGHRLEGFDIPDLQR